MSRSYTLALAVGILFLYTSCSKTNSVVQRDPAAILDSLLENLDPNAESLFIQNAGQDPRVNNRAWQGIPSIGASKDSKQIYVAWYSGGRTEGSGNYVTVALSVDKGKTFMNDKLVVFPADSGLLRFFDPSIWRDKNDNIWLTWAKSHNWWDGKGGVWTSRISWNGSSIEHKDVESLSKGIMMNKPVYVGAQNCMLFPVSMWNIPPTDPSKEGIFIYKAEYRSGALKTDSLSVISQLYLPDSLRTFDEHQIVELNTKGKMMCMVRTKAGIYYAISQDFGSTWTALKPFTAVGPTASSRFHVTRLRSGKILLIANNSRERTKLTAFLSSDGGNTWPVRTVLDSRANISYPDAIQTDDGFIHVVYDRDRMREKEIVYCKFKEADLLSWTSTRSGIDKIKVNSH